MVGQNVSGDLSFIKATEILSPLGYNWQTLTEPKLEI